MGRPQNSLSHQDDAALAFARRSLVVDNAELVSDRPWARTLRLSASTGASYLKIVPPHQAAVLSPIAALAERFAQHMPRVLAVDATQGFMLSADHGGQALDYASPPEQLHDMLRRYAAMQAACGKTPALYAALPAPDIAALPALLLRFLQPSDPAAATVGADYFISAANVAAYHRSFARRIELLQAHLQAAASLPTTLNHGDLRPPNAAQRPDGSCVLLDWDDAMRGPAGMSLHGMFGGCTVPTILLSGSAAAKAAARTPNGVLIHAYVDALADAGYADAATLARALPAAMCAGMIQFILNFAHYAGETVREAAGETIDARLADLLDLCDWLASHDRTTTLAMIDDYEAHGQLRRAERMLADHTLREPQDSASLLRLGALQRRRGHLGDAEETLTDAVQAHPNVVGLHAELGWVHTERLQLDAAVRSFEAALKLDAHNAAAKAGAAQANAMRAMESQALEPSAMPVLRFAPDAHRNPPPPELIALGASLFATHGTLQIDHAFSPQTVARLHETFINRYSSYFHEQDHPDALYLGDKRYMLTVDLDEPFDDPDVMGLPMVLPIVRQVLGDDCTLGAYTAVISLPGSANQRLHKDHPPLFPDTEWHHKLPCFAAQVIIPLVPLNEMSGTTRFYKGSHRVPTDDAAALGSQDPVVPLGSCLLNDYRCAHQGLGNRSDQVRPILTLVFHRRWFHDFKNYAQQPPLRMTDAAYERLPASMQPLFSVWKESREHQRLAQRQR